MRIAFLLIAILVSPPAIAAEIMKMDGIGVDNCEGLKDYSDHYSDAETAAILAAWVQGFLTDLNMTKAPNAVDVRGISVPLYRYMLKYCAADPQGDIFSGVLRFIQTLPRGQVN